jgi:hypothetical protein
LKYTKYLALIKALCFIVIAALFASCEKDDTSVLDPTKSFPKLLGVLITPTVYDTSDIKGVAWAEVTSDEAVTSVTITVKNPLNTEIGIFNLKDDGIAPDTTPGDGRYTGYFTFSMQCRIVGDNYKGEFIAKNVSGLTSSIISQNFSVINSNNHPPVISNLIIQPDSARITDTTVFIFKVFVTDPDGPCDIANVHYDGTKPLGGNLTRQFLFDDGSCCPIPPLNSTSGDSLAGDGIYTRIFKGAPDKLGYYVYHIKAVDRSGAESNILSDSIYVHP